MIAQTVKQRNDVFNCKGDHSSFSRSCPTWISKRRSRLSKLKIKFRIRRLGVLYRHARQFLEKAMRRRPGKSYINNSHSSRRRVRSKICTAESVQPKNVAVDTRKSVSTPPDVKKQKNTHQGIGGAIPQKKIGSNLIQKLHDMGDDVMDIHASQSDESLMDDLSPRPSSSGSLRGARAKT
ncbi:hypothetical protein TNCV_3610541 [Trichonephila clavipes]|nr:hypothetical protein TNCV_3610541 [Trichonephila clavipes]